MLTLIVLQAMEVRGRLAYGGQSGAAGGVGEDCIIGGRKAFAPGGFNQNNGIQRAIQADGGGNIF